MSWKFREVIGHRHRRKRTKKSRRSRSRNVKHPELCVFCFTALDKHCVRLECSRKRFSRFVSLSICIIVSRNILKCVRENVSRVWLGISQNLFLGRFIHKLWERMDYGVGLRNRILGMYTHKLIDTRYDLDCTMSCKHNSVVTLWSFEQRIISKYKYLILFKFSVSLSQLRASAIDTDVTVARGAGGGYVRTKSYIPQFSTYLPLAMASTNFRLRRATYFWY